MNYKTIETSIIEKGIMELRLNRPEAYNAVNNQMMEELEHFWL